MRVQVSRLSMMLAFLLLTSVLLLTACRSGDRQRPAGVATPASGKPAVQTPALPADTTASTPTSEVASGVDASVPDPLGDEVEKLLQELEEETLNDEVP